MPVLRKPKLPGTIYVTSYHCLKGTPVFRLVVQYMFWKTTRKELDLAGSELEDEGIVQLTDATPTFDLMWRIIRHGESQMDEPQRVRLSEQLGERLGVSYEQIVERRLFGLMTPDEIRAAASRGIDIELHTHRHCLPVEPALIRREIEQNRAYLASLVGYPPRHFCYPSGIHRDEHRPVLANLGVVSGTTCDPGLNDSDTPPLALRRFLDGSHIPRIVFEAEMSGLANILRGARSSLFGRTGG